MSQDGDTELGLGPPGEVPHEGPIAFDGVLEMPSEMLRTATMEGIVLASQTVGTPSIRVRVWTATLPTRTGSLLGWGQGRAAVDASGSSWTA